MSGDPSVCPGDSTEQSDQSAGPSEPSRELCPKVHYGTHLEQGRPAGWHVAPGAAVGTGSQTQSLPLISTSLPSPANVPGPGFPKLYQLFSEMVEDRAEGTELRFNRRAAGMGGSQNLDGI